MEDIESRYKEYLTKRERVVQAKMKIEAALTERKKQLRETMEECKKLGYDPDTISDDIKKMKEVLLTKLSICESDLDAAEESIIPMLKEIE